MTTKRERFLIAASGQKADRPPVGAWIHHGSSFWEPEQVAQAHLRYARHYDWDYIKVMNDYRLDLPEGLTEITDASQLDQVLADPSATIDAFAQQREVLRLLRAEAPDVAIIETVFSPTQTLVRALGSNVVTKFFAADAELAKRTTARVAEALAEYVASLSSLGVDALFLAVNGASQDASSLGLTPEQFRDIVAPFDKQVLQAASGLVRIAHLHGQGANPQLIRDYPVEVLSWSDRDSLPEIDKALPDYGWVPMLGIDEVHSLYWTPNQTKDYVLAARRAADDRIIIAPNCTLHSDESPRVLQALRQAVDLELYAAAA